MGFRSLHWWGVNRGKFCPIVANQSPLRPCTILKASRARCAPHRQMLLPGGRAVAPPDAYGASSGVQWPKKRLARPFRCLRSLPPFSRAPRGSRSRISGCWVCGARVGVSVAQNGRHHCIPSKPTRRCWAACARSRSLRAPPPWPKFAGSGPSRAGHWSSTRRAAHNSTSWWTRAARREWWRPPNLEAAPKRWWRRCLPVASSCWPVRRRYHWPVRRRQPLLGPKASSRVIATAADPRSQNAVGRERLAINDRPFVPPEVFDEALRFEVRPFRKRFPLQSLIIFAFLFKVGPVAVWRMH